MAPDALTNCPPLELSDRREIEDLTAGDPVAELVGGRTAYLSDLVVDDCLLPSGRGPREPAVFDRCYYENAGEPRILVDVLSGGSAAEISDMEAQRRVAEKREWCKAHGVEYRVHIDQTLSEYS
jgi:hypothetical protein